MKRLLGLLVVSTLAGLLTSALAAPAALPDNVAEAIKTQPLNPNWPAPYKPKSRRDFTGMWDDVGSGGWDAVNRPGPTQKPPYTAAFMPIWRKLLDNLEKGTPSNNPAADCLPQGMPRIMHFSHPGEITQNDHQVNIYAEWNEQMRRIYTDGRPFSLDNGPTYYGQSSGHWEGDALVATTVGIRGDTNLEGSGMPHSDALVVYEKIWLADDNTLKDEITLVDRKAFTHPWVVTRTYQRMKAGEQVMPYVCLENNRNPQDASGATTVVLHGNN